MVGGRAQCNPSHVGVCHPILRNAAAPARMHGALLRIRACRPVCPAMHAPLPRRPCLLAATAQLALLAPWLQTLDFLHQKCTAGARPLLTPSVADPAFDYSLAAAVLVWGGPWPEPPVGATMTEVQQIWIHAAQESAQLLMLCAHWHRLETARGADTPLAPRVKEECQRLLGFLMEVGLCIACACGKVRSRLGAAACVHGGASAGPVGRTWVVPLPPLHARCCHDTLPPLYCLQFVAGYLLQSVAGCLLQFVAGCFTAVYFLQFVAECFTAVCLLQFVAGCRSCAPTARMQIGRSSPPLLLAVFGLAPRWL